MNSRRIGITGHRGLGEDSTRLVDLELRRLLSDIDPSNLVGVTCLADGADTLFAQAVVDLGGQIEVVIPAAKYRAGLPVEHHPDYDRLLEAASQVHVLEYEESTSEAHMAASERLLDLASEIYAVWDGLPARGFGGTADVVEAARRRSMPVTVIWPVGAVRG